MRDIESAVMIMRGLILLGITIEDFRAAIANPDMPAEELATLLRNNSDRIRELIEKDHA